MDKARSIFDFVRDLLGYKYPSFAPELASHILFSEYGQCTQYSILFVGLCRAVQIPARTVHGYVSADPSFEISHQWAEFMDEEGYWHKVDASSENRTMFDFSDAQYFDFYYAEYQNPFAPSQLYFPSLWHTSGELSLKSVTLDLESNFELFCLVVNDSILLLLLIFVLEVCFILLVQQIEKKKEK